eukprot:306385_1
MTDLRKVGIFKMDDLELYQKDPYILVTATSITMAQVKKLMSEYLKEKNHVHGHPHSRLDQETYTTYTSRSDSPDTYYTNDHDIDRYQKSIFVANPKPFGAPIQENHSNTNETNYVQETPGNTNTNPHLNVNGQEDLESEDEFVDHDLDPNTNNTVRRYMGIYDGSANINTNNTESESHAMNNTIVKRNQIKMTIPMR